MEKMLLAYFLNHPEESLKIDDDIFTDNDLRKIFCVIKDRQLNHKAITPDLICKDAKTFYGVADIIGFQMINCWTKQEFQEYFAEYEINKRLNSYDKLFSNAFKEFTEKKTPKEKLESLVKLKERLSVIDTSFEKYKIKSNPILGEEWLENYNKPAEYRAKTGILGIDKIIGGLRGTELCLIIADTGIGKTNLMLNIAHKILQDKKSLLFFSLEMSDQELLDRFIPIVGDHNAFQVRERSVKKDFLHNTVMTFKNYDLKIIFAGNITSNDVVSEMINNKPDVVMVDYLQRLNDDMGRNNEMERLKGMVRRLKNACLSLEIPIITPAQVDKASSTSGKIRVENVAGAKDIANEADLAFYLYEKEVKSDSVIPAQKFETYLKIVKSRHSQKGADIKINFDTHNLRMTDFSQGKDLNQISREI